MALPGIVFRYGRLSGTALREDMEMGILKKLLGNGDAGKAAKNFLNDIAKTVKETVNEVQKPGSGSTVSASSGTVSPSAVPEEIVNAPSGDSWGPVMPEEENQYNFPGPYDAYFDSVFRSEFPEYRIERENVNNGRATVFSFYNASGKALAVEVISRKSSPYSLRKKCAEQGIPYLRYYYDYEGWWNTRSYVIRRTRNALRG